jgi:hypothetical protein
MTTRVRNCYSNLIGERGRFHRLAQVTGEVLRSEVRAELGYLVHAHRHDRDLRQRPVSRQTIPDLATVDHGEGQVEYHHVGVAGRCQRERFVAIRGTNDLEPVVLEQVASQLDAGGMVVDDERTERHSCIVAISSLERIDRMRYPRWNLELDRRALSGSAF